jgi:type VI secretion system protein ImpF
MARNIAESSATVSVLDRLIDEDPANPYEVPMSRAQSVRAVKASLRRDLEWLLNARRIAVEPPEGLKELNRSLYMFGLPDLIGFALASPKDRARLLRILQNTLRILEPRLANVRIVPMETAESGRQRLAFRIDGLLIMDPAPEHVSFDTVLELAKGEYLVRGDADAG